MPREKALGQEKLGTRWEQPTRASPGRQKEGECCEAPPGTWEQVRACRARQGWSGKFWGPISKPGDPEKQLQNTDLLSLSASLKAWAAVAGQRSVQWCIVEYQEAKAKQLDC